MVVNWALLIEVSVTLRKYMFEPDVKSVLDIEIRNMKKLRIYILKVYMLKRILMKASRIIIIKKHYSLLIVVSMI